LSVRPSAGRAHRDERRRRHGHEDDGRHRERGQAQARARAQQDEHEIDDREEDGGRGQGERDGISIEISRRMRQERAERARARGQRLVVQEPPAEDARRIVGGEMARDEEKEAGNDGAVDGKTRRPAVQLFSARGGRRDAGAARAHDAARPPFDAQQPPAGGAAEVGARGASGRSDARRGGARI